ncbi:MAG: sigma-54-dependent Fis family transcriptional regulator [Candidatus Kapabacteria bacterium]|nr:sigma-54-dependent Fis family transcriptional regulator [Candidatus Kapabacteria bacterium]
MNSAMKILIVDDNRDFSATIADVVSSQGWTHEVRNSPEQALAYLAKSSHEVALMLLDIEFGSESSMTGIDVLGKSIREFPSIPIIMISGKGTIEMAVQATKLGAINFIDKSTLSNDRLIEVLSSAMDRIRATASDEDRRRIMESHGIIGTSRAMMDVADLILRYGRTDLNVLVLGETGTGKKLVAQALHAVSRRARHPFVTVDIPNIPRDLFQSELFGHTRGSFSGAMENKRGLFHQANKGTLFMDEIGDMPPELQANLLLPMEQRGVRRLGSVEVEDVDIRFVSATDRDLLSAMADGRFREQLYHRLRECEIFIPPLRERTDDVPAIVEYYITKHNKDMGDAKSVSPGAIDYLREYSWPGNVRELASTLRVALQTMSNDELEVADLHRILGRATLPVRPASQYTVVPTPAPAVADPEPPTSDDRSKIEAALTRTAGNVSKAAAILGMSRETLHNRIKKIGIDVANYRP